MRHNDTTIFHYVHCGPLSIFNMLTQPFFRVVSDFLVSQKNEKWLIFYKQIVIMMIFATLVAGAFSDDRLQRKSS